MDNQTPEPTLNDVGTRYDHLKEHLDGLVTAIEALKLRARSRENNERLLKLTLAAEVLQGTLDAYSGLNDPRGEFYLYRLFNGIPKNPEEIEGGRGTPLI